MRRHFRLTYDEWKSLGFSVLEGELGEKCTDAWRTGHYYVFTIKQVRRRTDDELSLDEYNRLYKLD